ncbi:GNAT family N-acetyltransferase [Devosia limi]|nr:GNAT family N-acetyltransferase [Devosia limi]
MRVDLIDTAEGFAALREQWDAVYAADSFARYFLSHRFLSGWLPTLGTQWLVLAARGDRRKDPYQAFFPLRLGSVRRPDGHYVNEVFMAGNYSVDYTGMLTEPTVERSAVSAFAARLKQMHWWEINLDYVPAGDRRYHDLAAHFPRAVFGIETEERVNKRDGVNNLVCPWARLPNSWDSYLDQLSANTRQKLRRLLRAFEADPEMDIIFPSAESFDGDMERLSFLWASKWAARKGEARTRTLLKGSAALLRESFSIGDLFMPMLRRNGRMVVGLASFLDRQKKAAHFYMTGRDETYEGASPGLLLHAWSIRHLIDQGFVSYDFMRGDEPYKWLFAGEQLDLQCLRIATRSQKNLGERLDLRSLPVVVEGATALHRKGRVLQAATAYKQVLAIEPDNVNALYRYGQLLEDNGDYTGAGRLYRRLLTNHPGSKKAWLRLSNCLAHLGHLTAASDASRRGGVGASIH